MNILINQLCFSSFVRSSPGSTKRSNPCLMVWTTTGHTGTRRLRCTMQRWRPLRTRRRNWKRRKPGKVEKRHSMDLYICVYSRWWIVQCWIILHEHILLSFVFLQLAEVKQGSQKPAPSAKSFCCLNLGWCNLVWTNLGYSSLFQLDKSSSWIMTRLAWSGLVWSTPA